MKRPVLCMMILVLMSGFLLAQISPGELVPTSPESVSPDSLKVDLKAASTLDSLFYAADSIRAYYQDEQIWLHGNTSIDYGGSKIEADSLFLDLKKEQATTFGLTLMQDNGQLLIGEDVRYDIRSQTGRLTQGQSYIENGYYSGSEIRKIDSKIYDIDGGSFTTCDLADPSFWFWAKAMRIYQKDKVVGKHVVAYVNHMPVFYFPFVTMSIKRGRHAGILVPEPGFNSVDGKYIRDLAIYYPYKDYADFTLGMDLMEKTGWKAKFDTKYLKRYLYNGGLAASYQKNTGRAGTQFDWSLRANHHHELPEKSALDIALDFISNKRIWQGSDLVDESLAQRLSSSISYRKPIGNTYLNAGLLYNQDLINDTANLSLPSASWSVSSRPVYELFGQKSEVWYAGLSYHYNVRLDHSGDIRSKSPSFQDYIWANTPDEDNPDKYLVEHHAGIRHSMGLSNSYNYRGWLNFRQSLDYNEAWFDRNRNQKKWVRGNDYSGSLNGSFNLYGLRSFGSSGTTAVRHVMTPAVSLTYLPDHSDNSQFYGFGGISLRQNIKEQLNLNFSIAQKWQLKLGKERSQRKLNDLFTWDSRIAANLKEENKRFGDISHTLGFRPGSFNLGSLKHKSWALNNLKANYNSRLSLTQETHKMGFDALAIKNQYFSQTVGIGGDANYMDYFPMPLNRTFSAFGEDSAKTPGITSESWNLSVSHDLFSPKSLLSPKSQNLRMNAGLKLTQNFSLSYSNYYNLKGKELISQSINLSRDLHCWKLDFSFTKRNEYWDYRIVFFNKQFPDALKFKTSDSKKY